MTTYRVRVSGEVRLEIELEADSVAEAIRAGQMEALPSCPGDVEWGECTAEETEYSPHPDDTAYEAAREYADECDAREDFDRLSLVWGDR